MTQVDPPILDDLVILLLVHRAQTIVRGGTVALSTVSVVPLSAVAEFGVKWFLREFRIIHPSTRRLLRGRLILIIGRLLRPRFLHRGGLVIAGIHGPEIALFHELRAIAKRHLRLLALGGSRSLKETGEKSVPDRLKVDLVRETTDLRGDRGHGWW